MLTRRLPISLGAADAIGGGGQGKAASDKACPSVTQKRPLASHFPTARWVALGHENESTGLPESGKRHWKTRAGTGAAGVIARGSMVAAVTDKRITETSQCSFCSLGGAEGGPLAHRVSDQPEHHDRDRRDGAGAADQQEQLTDMFTVHREYARVVRVSTDIRSA